MDRVYKGGATRVGTGAGAPSEFQLAPPSALKIFIYFDKLFALSDNQHAILAFCKQLCCIFIFIGICTLKTAVYVHRACRMGLRYGKFVG